MSDVFLDMWDEPEEGEGPKAIAEENEQFLLSSPSYQANEERLGINKNNSRISQHILVPQPGDGDDSNLTRQEILERLARLMADVATPLPPEEAAKQAEVGYVFRRWYWCANLEEEKDENTRYMKDWLFRGGVTYNERGEIWVTRFGAGWTNFASIERLLAAGSVNVTDFSKPPYLAEWMTRDYAIDATRQYAIYRQPLTPELADWMIELTERVEQLMGQLAWDADLVGVLGDVLPSFSEVEIVLYCLGLMDVQEARFVQDRNLLGAARRQWIDRGLSLRQLLVLCSGRNGVFDVLLAPYYNLAGGLPTPKQRERWWESVDTEYVRSLRLGQDIPPDRAQVYESPFALIRHIALPNEELDWSELINGPLPPKASGATRKNAKTWADMLVVIQKQFLEGKFNDADVFRQDAFVIDDPSQTERLTCIVSSEAALFVNKQGNLRGFYARERMTPYSGRFWKWGVIIR